MWKILHLKYSDFHKNRYVQQFLIIFILLIYIFKSTYLYRNPQSTNETS